MGGRRGSNMHDHSRKGIIPGGSRIFKNRKSIKQKVEVEKLKQIALDVEGAVKRVENEGALVPVKTGKVVKASQRPTSTPPPHRKFRKSNTRKLTHGKMRVVVRQMVQKKKAAESK